MLAAEGERRLRPGPVHDLELLVEELHAGLEVVVREAVGGVLALVPTGAQSELDATTGDVIGGGDQLGQLRRVAERDRGDHRPEPQRLGLRRQRNDRPERVE